VAPARFCLAAHEAAIRRLELDSACRIGRWLPCRIAWRGENDSMAAALWEAHRRREAARLAGLSNKPRVRPRRPRHLAFRFAPILALVVRSPSPAAGATTAWLPPHAGLSAAAAGGRQSVDRAARLYRKPPIYLDMAEHDKLLRVPVGSKLAGFVDDVRGRSRRSGDRRQGHRVRHRRQGQVSDRAVITEGKDITLQARGDEQARWKLHVIPDLAPTSSSPGRSASTSGRPRSTTSPATISA